MVLLSNRRPQWNETTASYILNFGGRVTVPSVKNFQIVHEQDPDYIAMQFGRISDNEFTLDVRYPFTISQAVSVALTSLDPKLACE
ncbi:hypothetical protein GQ42DRAFT_116959 [Ramicandelaber brevisporus]|nr:hypothetical protein GQ42DRAFT_116959 [Ramicandelaber brevisporus]